LLVSRFFSVRAIALPRAASMTVLPAFAMGEISAGECQRFRLSARFHGGSEPA